MRKVRLALGAALLAAAVILAAGCGGKAPAAPPAPPPQVPAATEGAKPFLGLADIKEITVDPRVVVGPDMKPKVVEAAPFDTENVRTMLQSWYPVSKFEWEHGYSHVAFLDRTGSLVLTDGSRLQWGIRPGGLGWLKHPDGRVTHLASEVRLGPPSAGVWAALSSVDRAPFTGGWIPARIWLKNGLKNPVKMDAVQWGPSWTFAYKSLEGGRAFIAVPLLLPKPPPKFPPLIVEAGGRASIKLNYSNCTAWRFRDAAKPEQKWEEMVESLPPDKYLLTATFTHQPLDDFWSGSLATAPLLIEFNMAGGGAAPEK